MNDHELLHQIRIFEPCPMSWAAMQGNDRIRHCDACGKNVHDFTRMTTSEAANLLQAHDNEICGRVYERPDGTLVIGDCPPAPRVAPTPFQFSIRSMMVVIAGVAATLGFARLFAVSEEPPPVQPTPTVRPMVLGALKCVPPSQPAVSQPVSGPTCSQPN
jgi:hypothetical protein